jgi:hypothetical protein
VRRHREVISAEGRIMTPWHYYTFMGKYGKLTSGPFLLRREAEDAIEALRSRLRDRTTVHLYLAKAAPELDELLQSVEIDPSC